MFLKNIFATVLFSFSILQSNDNPLIDFLSRIQLPPIEIKVSTENLKNIIDNSGDLFRNNADKFFAQLAISLPKMGPGIIRLGESIGQAMIPARIEIFKGVLGVSGIITTAFLIKYLGSKYITKYMYEPALVEKKSSKWFNRPANLIELNNHMVINEQREKDLNYIMMMTKNIKINGGQFENILFFGEPGTGKTLFATLIAEYSGMDYAIIPAANVSQFLTTGTAVEELNKLFEWASKSRNGTILFFDEAETFLADRSLLSMNAQNVLNSFLTKTGTPSNKIMIICATNRPNILDKAINDRFLKIEFPLPDLNARIAQLNLHIKKIFKEQTGKKIEYCRLQDKEFIINFAKQLENHSGRVIQKFINRLRQVALAQNTLVITDELIDQVLKQTLKI